MSVPTTPVHLPPLTFLMCDHTTAQLAVDVAEVLSSLDGTLYVDDFLAPIHQGLQSMFDIDWQRDLADPKNNQRLMLESASGDASERDILVSLEKWFNETFGEPQLGLMGLKRMKVNRDLFAYPYLFRDATPRHIAPFIADASIARRDMLMVWLTPYRPDQSQPANVTMLTWTTPPLLDQAVLAITEASR